jgi:hypothetical protein
MSLPYTSSHQCAGARFSTLLHKLLLLLGQQPKCRRYHITKYTTLYGHKTLVHHSVVYACLPDNAQPEVEQLISETGPGPYNQNKYKQLCEAFYMVRGSSLVLAALCCLVYDALLCMAGCRGGGEGGSVVLTAICVMLYDLAVLCDVGQQPKSQPVSVQESSLLYS